jgi:hypothetical protein
MCNGQALTVIRIFSRAKVELQQLTDGSDGTCSDVRAFEFFQNNYCMQWIRWLQAKRCTFNSMHTQSIILGMSDTQTSICGVSDSQGCCGFWSTLLSLTYHRFALWFINAMTLITMGRMYASVEISISIVSRINKNLKASKGVFTVHSRAWLWHHTIIDNEVSSDAVMLVPSCFTIGCK